MNDVDRLSDNHISQKPVIEDKKLVKQSSKRMMNKSKARIHMLDDTEEYIDLHVCRNLIEEKKKQKI
jgi:hypothetical protein